MKRTKLTCLLTLTCLLLTASISFSGEWETLTEIDPFTDLRLARVGLKHVDGVYAYLIVQCQNQELILIVDFYFTKMTAQDVRYRVGKNEAYFGDWDKSTIDTAIIHPQPYAFLDELLTTTPKKLVIETWSQEDYQQLSFFDVDGIKDALKPIKEAGCNQDSK